MISDSMTAQKSFIHKLSKKFYFDDTRFSISRKPLYKNPCLAYTGTGKCRLSGLPDRGDLLQCFFRKPAGSDWLCVEML